MSVHIILVRKLPGKKRALFSLCILFYTLDAAHKAPIFFTDQDNFCPKTSDEVLTFITHPNRHKNRHRVSQCAPDRGKCNSRVAAGDLDNLRPRIKQRPGITLFDDTERHAILDAAGHIQVFSFSVKLAVLSLVKELNDQKRRVANQALQPADPVLDIIRQFNTPITDINIPELKFICLKVNSIDYPSFNLTIGILQSKRFDHQSQKN